MDQLNRLASDFSTWEELNEYVGMKRSIPFEKYFEPMHIDDDAKEKRIRFADDIEEEIVYLMAYLFYANRNGMLSSLSDSDIGLIAAFSGIQSSYIDSIGQNDAYTQNISGQFPRDLYEATKRHAEDPYFYSLDRARLASEDESNTANNYVDYLHALRKYRWKRWDAIIDGRERRTHAEVHGTIIPVDDFFFVGNSIMRYPKDLQYDPEIEEIAGCRCSATYIK